MLFPLFINRQKKIKMAVIPLRNRGKLDELSPVAKFVLTSYYKNLLDFAVFFA